ncbi:hypothetical protein ACHQM5_007670 [Ranunculus cassubicifolius]
MSRRCGYVDFSLSPHQQKRSKGEPDDRIFGIDGQWLRDMRYKIQLTSSSILGSLQDEFSVTVFAMSMLIA